MVGTASVLAGVVTVAVINAVVAPLLADEEGEGLRILGDVGNDAVLAHTLVGQVIGIAGILGRGHGGDAGLLKANERALSLILAAPVVSVALGDGIGVDRVWVVELGRALGSCEASKGGSAEGKGRTHLGKAEV